MGNEHERISVGTWVQINNPEVVEMAAISGFDFLILDMEHGNFDFPSLENLLRAAESHNVRPIVRVQENDPASIMKALDLGAKGVLIPQVATRQDAERAVQAAKYAPVGARGACPFIRAGGHLITQWEAHANQSNQQLQVIALVEGKEGIDNLEAIVATPGIDALMIGPFDLSVSLGISGQVDHPLIDQKFDEAAALAHRYGKTLFGVDFQTDYEGIKNKLLRWRARGVTTIVSGADKAVILNGFNALVSVFR